MNNKESCCFACFTKPILSHVKLNFFSPTIMFRKDRWVGLLYLSDNDAQTDAAGRPQDRNPGGLEDDGQTEERLHPGIWAPGQAHHVGRETHKQRRYKNKCRF